MSVIVAAWNAAATLDRAVDSALAQRGVALEVIVVDDASSDATLDVARAAALRDPRVRIEALERNAGPSAARNRGLDAARGDFVAPLDSDDFMEPDRLATLLAVQRDGGWDVVADDLLKAGEDDPHGPRRRLHTAAAFGLRPIDLAAFVEGNLTRLHGGRGELGFVKPLIAVEFLRRHGLRYREEMRLGEDYALYAHALALGARFCLTDPAGYVAVVRGGSLSGSHGAEELGALVRADRRLLEMPGLPPAARRALRRHHVETLQRWHWVRLIDAVKARDWAEAARCFGAPPPVMGSLAAKLAEQAVLRGRRRARRTLGRGTS